MHYVGDHTVFVPFKHRNSQKQIKPFIRSAPHVKDKVCSYLQNDTFAQAVYRKLVNESTGEIVCTT